MPPSLLLEGRSPIVLARRPTRACEIFEPEAAPLAAACSRAACRCWMCCCACCCWCCCASRRDDGDDAADADGAFSRRIDESASLST